MKTGEFFRRNVYFYLYVAAFFLAGASMLRWSVEQVDASQQFAFRPLIILDAGHGGMDSGATSPDGIAESDLNLEIANRLDTLLHLLGWETKMTRRTPDSIDTEGETIRQRKQSDLNNRVKLANETENAIVLSIHQNFYPDSRYHGAQVFYAGNGDQRIAAALQSALNTHLTPGTNRESKRAEGVYLMRKIRCPGVLLECGFLSNPSEAQKLQSAQYQNQLCCVIAATLINSVTNAASA